MSKYLNTQSTKINVEIFKYSIYKNQYCKIFGSYLCNLFNTFIQLFNYAFDCIG